MSRGRKRSVLNVTKEPSENWTVVWAAGTVQTRAGQRGGNDTKVIQEGEGSTYGAWLVVRNGGEEGVEEALTQYSLSGPCVNFKVLCDL